MTRRSFRLGLTSAIAAVALTAPSAADAVELRTGDILVADDAAAGGQGAVEIRALEHVRALGAGVNGGSGRDRILGEQGADDLLGKRGKDLLNGGKGHDELEGGKGRDKLRGGKGEDDVEQ